MTHIPRIDKLLPGLFGDGPYIDDDRAAEILRQMSARRRFDDVGAIAQRWAKLSDSSRMRFRWFMTAANQMSLWVDSSRIGIILPAWKYRANEALEELKSILPPDDLPHGILTADIEQMSRGKGPLLGALEAYAESARLIDSYRNNSCGSEVLERAAFLLRQSADLMALLPTIDLSDLKKLHKLCISLYDHSRAVFLDAVGTARNDPVCEAFLATLEFKIMKSKVIVEAGEMFFEDKKGGGEGGGNMGSAPPTGDFGGEGFGGGLDPASAKGETSDQYLLDQCSLDSGVEPAMLGIQTTVPALKAI